MKGDEKMKIDNLIAGTIEDEFGETCPSRLVTQIIRICSERALEKDKEILDKVEFDRGAVRKAITEGTYATNGFKFEYLSEAEQELVWNAADNITEAKGIIKIKEAPEKLKPGTPDARD